MGQYRAVVVISHPSLGGNGTNTFHARTTTPEAGEELELEVLAEYLRTFYFACNSIFPTAAKYNFNGEWFGVGSSTNEYKATEPWEVSGTGAGSILPPANALCVNWRGQSGDRSRRGRTFLGPIVVSKSEADGTPVAAVLTQVRDAAAALVASSELPLQGALGVWSRQESVFRDFVASSVHDQFAVLRSRRD